jgi:hypothetical protein
MGPENKWLKGVKKTQLHEATRRWGMGDGCVDVLVVVVVVVVVVSGNGYLTATRSIDASSLR